jgi:Fic family protein
MESPAPTSPEALHQVAALLKQQNILARVDQQKATLDAVRPLAAAVEAQVLQKIRLDWNFHSNVLEGNTLTLGETRLFLMHGLTAKGKPFKDYLDIRGHDTVLDYLFDLVRQQEVLTEAVLRELHKILLVEPYQVKAETPDGKIVMKWVEPGQYKTTPNHVRTLTGRVHYYATPEETPARMDDLMRWYREADGQVHPLVVATLFHHTFTAIHPFDDGNGRMARLLTNLMLMRHGYVPMVVRQEHKDRYLYALASADQGSPTDLLDFFGEQVLDSIDLYLRAARGEEISELGDFDKRLALLKQELETAGNPVKRSLETQVQAFEDYVVPLMKRLIPKFEQVDDLFLRHQCYANFQDLISRNHRNISEKQDREQEWVNVRTVVGQNELFWLKTQENWGGFRRKPDQSLPFELFFQFEYDHFLIRCEDKQVVKPYGEPVTEEELDHFAAQVLDVLYKKLDALVHQK